MKQQFFEFYNEKDWRDRIVVRRTPKTNKLTKKKISSLPPEIQKQYAPLKIKSKEPSFKKSKTGGVESLITKDPRVFDIYVATDDPDKLENIEDGDLVIGSVNPSDVIEFFDPELYIVKIKNLPVEAVKKYLDGDIRLLDDIDNFNFKNVSELDEEELYELVGFSENNIMLVNLFPYKDRVEIKIDSPFSDDDDFDELKESNVINILKSKLITEDEDVFKDFKESKELNDFYTKSSLFKKSDFLEEE